jgi:hypothetical protein
MWEDPNCGVCYLTNNNYEQGNWTLPEAATYCTMGAGFANCEWECGPSAVGGRTTPKLSDTQLQSMSVEELEKVKKDLIRKKP